MIRLEPFTADDIPGLLRWVSSHQMLIQWAGPRLFTWPLDAGQLHRYVQESLVDPPPSRIFKAVNDENLPVGHLELGAIDRNSRIATLCRVMVAPEARGMGLCLPMIQAALSLAFVQLDFRRIDLRVYSFNDPAIQCYLKAGFVREGVLRQAVRVGDVYWDTVLMAIMKEEWERLRPPGPPQAGAASGTSARQAR